MKTERTRPRWRLPGALALAATMLLAGAGCSLNRPLARQAEAVVAAARPAATDCNRIHRCAIDSPYQVLAKRARATAGNEAGRHYVTLLERGEDALLLRVHLIRSARHSIDLQTFIWADDDAGWLLLDELVAAARRGVRVRLLADQLFSIDSIEWLARIARIHANLELRLYNPAFGDAITPPVEFAAGILCCFTRFNQRMHNKLLLVDGEIGVAGGRNIENRYFDWDPQFNYRDRDVVVTGPDAGAEMQASFEAFWNHPLAVPLTRFNDVNRRIVADGADGNTTLEAPAGIDLARIEILRSHALDPGYIATRFADPGLPVARVQYFSDLPGKGREHAGSAHAADLGLRVAELLQQARHEVVFETPYLVLSSRARKIFRGLHQRAQPVRVTVSTNSLAATDAFYVYALSYKYKKRYLRRYGFRIHEFKPFPADAPVFIAHHGHLAGGADDDRYRRYGRAPLTQGGVRLGLHAKSLVIDGATTLIGSHNFDPRSDHYNTESGFIIDDPMVSARVRAAVLRNTDPGNAWTIAPRQRPAWLERINDPIDDLSTALPLFDLWPFRYSSSFELDPGCSPLPPDDPRFHDCYTDVGDFPEVALPLKTIYTRIVTAFGAGLAGIL